MVVETLGQSPRGTRFIIRSRRFSLEGKSPSEVKQLVAKEVIELLPSAPAIP